MKKWDDVNYQKFIDAHIYRDSLVIKFANGDTVSLDVKSLIPVGYDGYHVESLQVNDYEIILNGKPSDIRVQWDQIRIISDPDFAKEMVKKSEEHSQKIGSRLKTLRERKGIKGLELAERAGVTPQTISRIEKGHTDIGFTTLSKILAAMGNSLADLANEELDVDDQPEMSYRFVLQKLNKAGLNTFANKILPIQVKPSTAQQKEKLPDLVISEISTYLNRIFGWSNSDIWSNKDLVIDESPSKLAYFKRPSRINLSQIRAYSHYAYYLACVVNNLNLEKPILEYPGDIEEFKEQYFKKNREISLSKLINHIWDMGISVIPLNDQGVFHGASWNINDKHVIVLKQRSESHARWIFDLLHEVYHVFAHLDRPNTSIVETEEPNPFADNDSPEELEANAFANEFIFGKVSENLALEALEKASFRLDYLKKAVKEISDKEEIRADFFANYLAFRLQINGQNWWGTANSFQIINPNPCQLVSTILRERINIQNLNPIDKNLLLAAIN